MQGVQLQRTLPAISIHQREENVIFRKEIIVEVKMQLNTKSYAENRSQQRLSNHITCNLKD